MKTKKYSSALLLTLLIVVASCKKQDEFLDAKPNAALVVPASLADLQGILNNENIFNNQADPALGELSSDDFYMQDAAWTNTSLAIERNTFIWAKSIYDASYTNIGDWNRPYQLVYYANVVLDALPKIAYPPSQQALYNQIRGSALFCRSYAFYNLLQTFAMPYQPSKENSQPGIPIRLNSDLNSPSVRSTEADGYRQVLQDLRTALTLLPATVGSPTQPSQPSANALLARVKLATGDYQQALADANSCLAKFNTLEDYNLLNAPTSTSIATNFLKEDIYHATMNNYSIVAVRRSSVVDSVIYAAFQPNDLRKTKFTAILDGLPQFPRFVGSYDFKGLKYTGLATDEIYLIAAECYARLGNKDSAIGTLNTLLKTRWKTGTFVPYTASDTNDALNQILLERWKELLYRGLRWTDLRRLNQDSRFALTLTRKINGVTYTLPPGDRRYAMPIPDNEISLSGLTQNPR